MTKKSFNKKQKLSDTRASAMVDGDFGKIKIPTDELATDVAKYNILFCDQYSQPWLAVDGDGAKLLQIGSSGFKFWLNHYAFEKYGCILKGCQLKDITEGIKGIAFYNGDGHRRLETRTGFANKALWYDLGGKAVKVERGNWQIVDKPPILFRRFDHQAKQVIPVADGDVQSLRQFVNVGTDEDWVLFLTFAISAFLPNCPKPILVLNGSQGAGKSTPMRMLKKLVDPSIMLSCGTPSGTDELARLANRHTLLFFDNLSSLSGRVSDDLCRLVTGDGFSKRTLYTNDDETIFTLKRAIMMNGINPFITRADLLDRTIILEVERIPEDKRLAEDELWRKFEAERPKILGGIFSILAKAMEIYETVKTDNLPRMADFYKWGLAINQALCGTSDGFANAYTKNIERQVDEAIQANPVAIAAIMLTNGGYDCNFWEGTATKFFDHFEGTENIDKKYLKRSVMWPEDPSGIGRALKRAEASLKAKGFTVEHFRQDNERMIRITDENRAEAIAKINAEREEKEKLEREKIRQENAEREERARYMNQSITEAVCRREDEFANRYLKKGEVEECDKEIIPF